MKKLNKIIIAFALMASLVASAMFFRTEEVKADLFENTSDISIDFISRNMTSDYKIVENTKSFNLSDTMQGSLDFSVDKTSTNSNAVQIIISSSSGNIFKAGESYVFKIKNLVYKCGINGIFQVFQPSSITTKSVADGNNYGISNSQIDVSVNTSSLLDVNVALPPLERDTNKIRIQFYYNLSTAFPIISNNIGQTLDFMIGAPASSSGLSTSVSIEGPSEPDPFEGSSVSASLFYGLDDVLLFTNEATISESMTSFSNQFEFTEYENAPIRLVWQFKPPEGGSFDISTQLSISLIDALFGVYLDNQSGGSDFSNYLAFDFIYSINGEWSSRTIPIEDIYIDNSTNLRPDFYFNFSELPSGIEEFAISLTYLTSDLFSPTIQKIENGEISGDLFKLIFGFQASKCFISNELINLTSLGWTSDWATNVPPLEPEEPEDPNAPSIDDETKGWIKSIKDYVLNIKDNIVRLIYEVKELPSKIADKLSNIIGGSSDSDVEDELDRIDTEIDEQNSQIQEDINNSNDYEKPDVDSIVDEQDSIIIIGNNSDFVTIIKFICSVDFIKTALIMTTSVALVGYVLFVKRG